MNRNNIVTGMDKAFACHLEFINNETKVFIHIIYDRYNLHKNNIHEVVTDDGNTLIGYFNMITVSSFRNKINLYLIFYKKKKDGSKSKLSAEIAISSIKSIKLIY
jgi:hypothetical protein